MKNLFLLTLLFVIGCAVNVSAEPEKIISNIVDDEVKNSDIGIKYMTKKFQDYLQNLKNVSGDFVQSSSNGDNQNGKFYISIPGKMKIEYENGVLILADGHDFIYYDKSNDQVTVLDLKTSPAGVLLSATKLDSVGAEIVKVEKNGDVFLLYTQVKNASMNAMIVFKVSENPFKLLGWIIKDMQGVTTDFSMQNVYDVPNGFASSMFVLPRKKTYGSDGVKSGDDYY